MPRRLSCLWAVALSLLALELPARAADRLETIRARGAVRVGMTGDYMPFSFRTKDGRFVGADVDMSRRLAARLGVPMQVVQTTWGRLSADFGADAFDIAVGGISITPARAAIGDFSTVLLVDGKRPVARCADSGRYASLKDIDRPDVHVVVNPGGTNEEFAHKELSHAQLSVHLDNTTVPDELLAGRADVFVTDGVEADRIAATHPGLCATQMPEPFTKSDKAYWLQRDAGWLSYVDGWLASQIGSGAWSSLLEAAIKSP